MPSTKVRKKTVAASSHEDLIKTVRTYGNYAKQRQKVRLDTCLKLLDQRYEMILEMMRKEDLEKTIGQLREEAAVKSSESSASASMAKDEECHSETSRSHGSRSLSRSNAVGRGDGGNARIRAMAPPSSYRAAKPGIRRRSSSAPNASGRASRAKYRTPMMTKKPDNFPPITPKVAPNTPVTLLRRPKPGERAWSQSGSPLSVNLLSVGEERANCIIPLRNGTMLSLIPEKLRQSSTFLPTEFIGPQTIDDLKSLRENLDAILNMAKKGKKQ